MLARVEGPGFGPATPVRLPAVTFLTAYVVLVLCVPARLVFGPLGAAGTPANVLGICGLLWWLLATARGLNPVKGWTPVRFVIAVLTVSVMLSYIAGMARGWYAPLSARESTSDVFTLAPPGPGQIAAELRNSADRSLLKLAGWAGVALMTADGMRGWHDLEALVRRVVWCATYVAVLGMVQFWTRFDIAGLYRIPGLKANAAFGGVDARSVLNRPASTATHPIEYGVVLAAAIPLALHVATHGPGGRWAKLPVLVIALAAAMSVSRSAVLVAAIAFVVLFVGSSPSWRLKAAQLLPVGIVATRLMVPGLVGTLIALFTNFNNDNSIQGRTGDYGVVRWIFSMHPWLGQGMGTFIPDYYRILDNQVLDIATELGIVGLIAMTVLYIVAFAAARRAYRFGLTGANRHLGLALSGSIAGLAVSIATFDAWSFPMATGVTFLTIGLAGAAWELTRQEVPRHGPAPRVGVAVS